jgi:DNA-damage-inducible protein J
MPRAKAATPRTGTIRARIDRALKAEAEAILDALGLNASEAIRLFFKQVTLSNGLPFDVRIPNPATRRALRDADLGKWTRRADVDSMFEALGDRTGC